MPGDPLSPPSLGAGQPAEVSQTATMFLMSSLPHLRSGSPGSHKDEGLLGQNSVQKDPLQVLL